MSQRVETSVLVIGHDEHNVGLVSRRNIAIAIANSRKSKMDEDDNDGDHDGGDDRDDAAEEDRFST